MSEPTPEPVAVEPTAEPTPQPEPTIATPSSTPFLNEEGKWAEEYISSLPDDLGKHSVLQKYDNPVDLIKGAINAQGLMGKKAHELLTSEDPAAVAARREAMGLPKDASGYEFDVGEVPEGMPFDKERLEAFKEIALKNELTPAQAQALVEADFNSAKEQYETLKDAEETRIREATEELRAEWKGDAFQINVDKIKGTLEAAGLEDWIEDPAIANNPTRLKQLLEKVVPLFSDDAVIQARMQENMSTLDDKLRELETKMRAHPNNNDPSYLNMVKERGQLLEKFSQRA